MDTSVDLPPLPEGFSVAPANSTLPPPPAGFFVSNNSPTTSSDNSSGILSRISADFDKRKAMGNEAADAYVAGKQTLPETYGQIVGKTMFGGAQDVLGEGLKSTGQTLSNFVPQQLKDRFSNFGNYLSNQDAVTSPIYTAGKEGLTQLSEAYNKFNKENPRASRNMDAVVDIGSALPIGKVLGAIAPISETTGNVLNNIGSTMVNSAENRVVAKKAAFAKNLITPKITPTIANEQFSRSTEKGLFNKAVVQPTPQELSVINTLSNLPINGRKSLLANQNIIQKSLSKEAETLQASLKANDVPIDLGDVQNAITNSFEQLKQNAFATGNGENAALKIINVMNKAVLDNAEKDGGITASNLLQSRKDFDEIIKSQKGSKIFDPSLEGPTSIAVQEVRQAINDLISSKVPNVAHKLSLQHQSNMYKALAAIKTKGRDEASNALKRMAQKMGDKIPLKSDLGKIVAGGLGAGAVSVFPSTAIPIVGAAGIYGGYKGLKAATSPLMQKGIGTVLDRTGNILKGESPLMRSGFGAAAENINNY